MSTLTLLTSAAFAVAAAVLYAYVGHRLGQREVSPEASLASHAFSAWWYGLALTSAISAVTTIAITAGTRNVDLLVALGYLSLLAVCVALWGLLYYLIFVFTGRRKAWIPLAIFYVLYYILLLYWLASLNPIGVDVQEWTAEIDYETEVEDSPMLMLILALLLLPQIIGALAYFTLFFRLTDPTQRYRVALVSWSIIVWFSSSYLASIAGLSEYDWWQLVSRFIGLTAALTILAAYVPPKWVRKRFGIEAVEAS